MGDLTYLDGREICPGRVHGQVVLHDGVVILEVWRGHVVGHSVKDGRRVWTLDSGGYGSLYGDRYYRLGGRGYQIVNPKSGRILFETTLRVPKAMKEEGVTPTFPLLVSETHVFMGSDAGYVLAFGRETGSYAWGLRPKGGKATGPILGADGRLFMRDATRTVYCFEEVSGR